MRLLVVDTETGGIHSDTDALLEIGAVVVDEELTELGTFETLVHPFPGLVVDHESIAVTSLDLRAIREKGLPEKEAITSFLQFSIQSSDRDGPPVLSGWNVSFDAAFLKAAFLRHGVQWPFGHRTLDVQSIWAFRQRWDFSGLQNACATVLGKTPPHRALPDALITVEVLRKLFAASKRLQG